MRSSRRDWISASCPRPLSARTGWSSGLGHPGPARREYIRPSTMLWSGMLFCCATCRLRQATIYGDAISAAQERLAKRRDCIRAGAEGVAYLPGGRKPSKTLPDTGRYDSLHGADEQHLLMHPPLKPDQAFPNSWNLLDVARAVTSGADLSRFCEPDLRDNTLTTFEEKPSASGNVLEHSMKPTFRRLSQWCGG